MRYRLIGENDYAQPLKQFLSNRSVKDIDSFINMSENVLLPYQDLAHIIKAAEIYHYHVEKNNNICIVVDSDTDGYTSAAMIYNYTKRINPECKLTYLLHNGKEHGLTEDITIPEDTQLLIIPDAGTNDTEQCKALKEKGIDIIVLDHHEQEQDNPYAVIVNNQCCDYTNKQLCGAGIVYKFLQACDEEMWNEEADCFLDLCALGNIADNMDMRSPETRYISASNIGIQCNKFFEAIVEAQSFSLPEIDIIGIQFYITPLINALIRMGTQEEKDILFRAFIEDEHETFTYKKRGETEPIEENVYERAVRFCKNAKNRQGKILEKQVPNIIEHIKAKGQDKHEVIISNVTEFIEGTLTGLVAMKIGERFHKPCILLRYRGCGIFGGSCRVPDTNPIENFKNVLNDLEICRKAQGHASAFGVEFEGININQAVDILDKYIQTNKLQDIGEVKVDFEIEYEDFDIGVFTDIAKLKPYYGCCLNESIVVIKNILVIPSEVIIQGKDSNSWVIMLCDETIKLVAFKRNMDDYILNLPNEEDTILTYINIIGKIGYSYYKGIKTAQIIVDDYEVIQ